MRDVIEKLIDFGFTKTEAVVYTTLLKVGKTNGYKLAKELNLSRSSVYQALESLYKNGYVLMTPNGSKEYEAKEPEQMFKEIEKRFYKNAESIKEQLKNIKKPLKKDYYLRIEGYTNILDTLQEIIRDAQKEIYLNTDFPLEIIKDELKGAAERGVRIIIFSFNLLKDIGVKEIEYYHKTEVYEKHDNPKRIMIVADLIKSFVVTSVTDKIIGTLTDNEIFVQIIAEHIHSDIYMARLAKIYEKAFEESISINSLHEKKNFIQ